MIGSDDNGSVRASVPYRRWLALGAILFLAAAVLGYWGFREYYRAAGAARSWWDLVYLSMQLFVLESGMVEGVAPWQLVLARMLSAVFTVSTVILALGGICRSELRALRLACMARHDVVCGVGGKAWAVVRELKRRNAPAVLVDPQVDRRMIRHFDRANMFVLEDDAKRPSCLEKARIRAARRIFVATGDDSVNVEIVSQIINLFRARGPLRRDHRPICYMHLVDRRTNELFCRNHAFREAEALVDMRIFNVYDNAARLLWRKHLMGRGPLAPDDSRRMRVVLCGMDPMTEAILLRIAKSGHFANGRKPAVEIVGTGAGVLREKLRACHPMLESICDLEVVDGDADEPQVVQRIAENLGAADDIGSVVLCADQDHRNFATALQLASAFAGLRTPVFVRLSLAEGLAALLAEKRSESGAASPVAAFGLVSDCCGEKIIVEDALSSFAKRFHQAYVRNRLQAGIPATDVSMKGWEDLDEQFRNSSREQAEHMELKLRTFGFSADPACKKVPAQFTPEQVHLLGRMEHARWCAERWLSGWSYAPPPKDAIRHTSPYLVSWEDLDKSVQEIDFETVREIPAVLAGMEGALRPVTASEG